MQSFFIPALGSQIYAMAGMVTELNLKADRPGRLVRREHAIQRRRFQQQHFTVRLARAGLFGDGWPKVRCARKAAR